MEWVNKEVTARRGNVDELDARAAGARRLKDKVCIVTGAGQGIGRAAAKRLAQEGGKLVVADRIEAAATETIGERRRFLWQKWRALAGLESWLAARRRDERSGDVYARLES